MSIFNTTLTILLPLVLNLIFTPAIIAIAKKNNLFDFTDERKTHSGQIPRLGGIGIFLSLFISAIILNILFGFNLHIGFYIALFLIFLSGVIDDFKPVKPIVKLLSQIVASLILIAGGYIFSHIYIPFFDINLNLGLFSYPITIIWVVGITNAINLLDGMDGQAGGVSIIASIALAIFSLILGNTDIAVITLILSGSLLGFLCFNFPPAKIFMGDSGSLSLGFFLAAIPLLFKISEVKGKIVLVTIALLIIPILDVFSAIIRRKKDGKSFFAPDRGHIHHKFNDFTSLNTRQILLVIYTLCIFSAGMAGLFLFKTNTITTLALLFNVIIHLLVFSFLHRRKKRENNLR